MGIYKIIKIGIHLNKWNIKRKYITILFNLEFSLRSHVDIPLWLKDYEGCHHNKRRWGGRPRW